MNEDSRIEMMTGTHSTAKLRKYRIKSYLIGPCKDSRSCSYQIANRISRSLERCKSLKSHGRNCASKRY